MSRALVATATIDIDAEPRAVWRALTDPELVRRYMFGTELITDWTVGAPIRWRGEWEGRAYEDHGEVLAVEPPRLLRVTHFSPLSAADDVPENHHELTYTLEPAGAGTHLTLEQDNAATEEEREHDAANWSAMLAALKETVEAEGAATIGA